MMTQQENCFRIDPDLPEGHTLYVYPVAQIHMDGHPEIAQFLSVTRCDEGRIWLRIKHPLGETYLKVDGQVLLEGLTTYLADGSA